ncbi:hypothetical protein MGH68_13540 [Erysipelothrix sp. D19-032]
MIRRATEQDLVEIVVIDTESLHNHWSLVSYNDAIVDSNYWFFVYEENGAIHGFVVVLNLDTEVEVLQIAVSPQRRTSRYWYFTAKAH